MDGRLGVCVFAWDSHGRPTSRRNRRSCDIEGMVRQNCDSLAVAKGGGREGMTVVEYWIPMIKNILRNRKVVGIILATVMA